MRCSSAARPSSGSHTARGAGADILLHTPSMAVATITARMRVIATTGLRNKIQGLRQDALLDERRSDNRTSQGAEQLPGCQGTATWLEDQPQDDATMRQTEIARRINRLQDGAIYPAGAPDRLLPALIAIPIDQVIVSQTGQMAIRCLPFVNLMTGDGRPPSGCRWCCCQRSNKGIRKQYTGGARGIYTCRMVAGAAAQAVPGHGFEQCGLLCHHQVLPVVLR